MSSKGGPRTSKEILTKERCDQLAHRFHSANAAAESMGMAVNSVARACKKHGVRFDSPVSRLATGKSRDTSYIIKGNFYPLDLPAARQRLRQVCREMM
jgi:hypothetical protein